MNCRNSMIVLVLLCSVFYLMEALSMATNQNATPIKATEGLNSFGEFLRNRKTASNELETSNTNDKQCTIEFQETRRIKGKCMRLFGGQKACLADDYMDPLNGECEDF